MDVLKVLLIDLLLRIDAGAGRRSDKMVSVEGNG